MSINKTVLSILFIFTTSVLFSQETKKPLDLKVYDEWERIVNPTISNDGKFITYNISPQEGDGTLYFYNTETKEKHQFSRGEKARFSSNSDFAVFKIVPHADTVRQAKLNKKKKEDMPKDSLGVFLLNDEKLIAQANLMSFKMPQENSAWFAYLLKHEKNESTEEKKNKEIPTTGRLFIYNPSEDKKHLFDSVSEYNISRNGDLVSFIQYPNDSIPNFKIFAFETANEKLSNIFENTGSAKTICTANNQKHTAFIFSGDTVKHKSYALYFSKNTKAAELIADTTTAALPHNYTASENGSLRFSRNDERLYFGTAPKPQPEQKDTLLEDEKVYVDIWHWQDKELQPWQNLNKNRELNRSYKAVFHINTGNIIQIEDSQLKNVSETNKGNGNTGLANDYSPYRETWDWEYPAARDVYTVDYKTGKREKIFTKTKNRVQLSPAEKYLYYYNFNDSTWYAYEIKTKQVRALTTDLPVAFYNEEHDNPNPAFPHGIAGWTKDDKHILIYDRYDIWKIDPTGKTSAHNLTDEYGRNNSIRFRITNLDTEAEWFEPKEDLFLHAFDELTKKSGYFTLPVHKPQSPEQLIFENMRFSENPIKAKSADALLWRKQNINHYPDLWLSSDKLQNPQKITSVNKERQAKYNWASVEEVSWINTDGKKTFGLLYKPENFDPNKQYPMMVYFYRKHSENIHRHYVPSPSASIISPLLYASRGYLVFMPDIKFKIGYPGESSYNHIISGTLAMINKGFVDKDNIGLQGQSWGGYQIAYIVTKTDLFKCASPGAPVSNMISAYGGIRWGSGRSRMFQYEQTQSRIGGTLWERPLHYIENSPIFYAPKINTPMLIRHNDNDGAVPWEQSIELFMSLRRLGKPAWLVNYNDGPHNLTEKRANRKDWSMRMLQFFDHYLKDEPAPVWLKHGIPATEKGKTMGYEIAD